MLRDLGYAVLSAEFEQNVATILAGQRP